MDYIVYKHLDYITYTTPLVLSELDTEDYEEKEKGFSGYTKRFVGQDTGTVVMFNPDRPEMKTHVIMSGDVCQWFRSNGYSDADIATMALERGKIRRIDIAITSHPNTICAAHEFTPGHQLQAIKQGKVTTKIKTNSEVSELGKIQTCYVGSRKKRKRLYRGYDKGIEQGFVSDWLQRYELQTSGDGSQKIARAVSQNEDIGALINRYIEFNNPVWQQIVGTESARLNHEPETKERDTIAWLRKIAAPALANVMHEYGNKELILEWFVKTTLDRYDKIEREEGKIDTKT